jgi:hypothetical protein
MMKKFGDGSSFDKPALPSKIIQWIAATIENPPFQNSN